MRARLLAARGWLAGLLLLGLACEPVVVEGLIDVAPPELSELPTNGVIVIETLGEVALSVERDLEGRVDALTPLTTRCAADRCFTPIPVGPAPAGASAELTLEVAGETQAVRYLFDARADSEPPLAAELLDEPPRARAPAEAITVVLVERASDGAALAGGLGPSFAEEIPFEVAAGVCVNSLVMDSGGNLTLSDERCY